LGNFFEVSGDKTPEELYVYRKSMVGWGVFHNHEMVA